MKIILCGGTGQLGALLRRHWVAQRHAVVVISRKQTSYSDGSRHVHWDGRNLGPWAAELEGADAVVNLAGRSVNCRYTAANLVAMRASRILSTQVVGEAIAQAARPPPVWLQMSTSTIYAHRFDAANDEATGLIGGDEGGPAARWRASVAIAVDWEAALMAASLPHTRRVAMRTSMVMSPDPGGIFSILRKLAYLGLGGAVAGGRQFVSWIHHLDFVRALDALLRDDDLSGPVNLAAPEPLPQREFMALLRRSGRIPLGLPATCCMAEIGAWALRTETELLLKSRRVVPGRLLARGFRFNYPSWDVAAADLMRAARVARLALR